MRLTKAARAYGGTPDEKRARSARRANGQRGDLLFDADLLDLP